MSHTSAELVATDDVIRPRTLARIIGMSPGAQTVIAACTGEWRREGPAERRVWRFWSCPEDLKLDE